MKKLLIVSAFIAVSIFAQTSLAQTAPAPCPKVNVGGPDEVDAGAPVTVSASIAGGNGANYTYNWTVSDGIITAGQGTSTIEVDTTDFPGKRITATVMIIGGDNIGENCERTGVTSVGIRQKPRPAIKFDEFGTLKPAEESAKLDNFALALGDDPTTTGYLIIYGGKTSLPTDFKKRATALMTYLVSDRGVNNNRLITKDGGYREQPFVELWIMPEGGLRPTATPTIPDPNKVVKPPPPTPKTTPKKK